MKHIYGYILTTLTALTLTACSFDTAHTDDRQQPDNNGTANQVRIMLDGSIAGGAAQTRTVNASVQTTHFCKGNTVGAFIYRKGQTTNQTVDSEDYGYTNRKYTSIDNTYTLYNSEEILFPDKGTGDQLNVDIYAYAPYNESWSSLAAQTFTVAENQTTDENYMKSDLLWVYKQATKPSTFRNPIELKFDHKLTQIKVVIEAGSALYESELYDGTVKLTGIGRTGTINLQTGAVSISGSGSAQTQELTVFTYAQKQDGSRDTDCTTGYAVVYPHTADELADAKLQFTLAGTTTTYEASLKYGNITKWDPGKTYVYTVLVSQAGLSVTTSLSDWVTGAETPGTAE